MLRGAAPATTLAYATAHGLAMPPLLLTCRDAAITLQPLLQDVFIRHITPQMPPPHYATTPLPLICWLLSLISLRHYAIDMITDGSYAAAIRRYATPLPLPTLRYTHFHAIYITLPLLPLLITPCYIADTLPPPLADIFYAVITTPH